MTDYKEALTIAKRYNKGKVILHDEADIMWSTIDKALRIAQAVEKDIADGWVMVPSEPTILMVCRGVDVSLEGHDKPDPTTKTATGDGIKAAIAAAPKSNIARELDKQE